MNLTPLSLSRAPRIGPMPHVPTNEERLRAWQMARPLQTGNVSWAWCERERYARQAALDALPDLTDTGDHHDHH